MDGLLLRIAYDLVLDLGKNGMEVDRLRVKSVPRGTRGRRFKFESYTGSDFLSYFADAVSHPRYLCAAGDFPVIECIETHNESNLGFYNSYRWYDLSGRMNVVQTRRYDGLRGSKYASDVDRYLQWQRDRFTRYVADCGASIEARNSEYVDPCYVDAGYVTRYGPATPAVVEDITPSPSFVCEGPEHYTITGVGSQQTYTYTSSGFFGTYGPDGATSVYASGDSVFPGISPCCVFSCDAAGVPAGSIDTLFLMQVLTADLSNLSSVSQLDILGYPTDLVVPASVNSLNLQEYQPTTIDLSTCPNLEVFSATSSNLQTVDFSVTPLMTQVTIQAAQLTTAGVDAIIIALAANGQTNGILYLDQGVNGPPSLASSAALSSLLANGWTVLTN